MLCAKFSWNWLIGSGEEDENVKILQQQQQRRHTNFNQKSSLKVVLHSVLNGLNHEDSAIKW